MPNHKLLRIYLNDHFAAGVAGRELARRALSNNRGTDYEPFLGRLLGDVEQDLTELEGLMERLGVARDPLKSRAAWMVEKIGRLKLNGQVRGYSPLSRLVELESLAVGIEGKLSLWRSLQALADHDSRLATAGLDGLIERAERQRAEVEDARLRAARSALDG